MMFFYTINDDIHDAGITSLKDTKAECEMSFQYLNYEKISPGCIESIRLLQEVIRINKKKKIMLFLFAISQQQTLNLSENKTIV
jgi:hypothetical protein